MYNNRYYQEEAAEAAARELQHTYRTRFPAEIRKFQEPDVK